MHTIVLCYPANQIHLAQIAECLPGADVVLSDDSMIAQDLMRATIFCGHAKSPVDWEAVVQAGKLQWIQSTAAGLDHCLHPCVVESSVRVTSASGLFSRQVAEHTLALLLALVRRLNQFFDDRIRRHYERRPTDDLFGKKVGIVGFGGNGQRIAQMLLPWVESIRATDRFPDPAVMPGVHVMAADRLDELFATSQIVIVTLPLTDQTRDLIGGRQFELMGPGGYFINVGRGQIVDEAALLQALSSGRLAGAGLDVFRCEPLPRGSEIWSHPKIVMSPHVGAQSSTRWDDVTELICANLRRFAAELPLYNLVDKFLGFPRPENRLPFDWLDAN